MQVPAVPENETERLAALYDLKILDTPPEDRFDRITRLAASHFDVPISIITLLDRDRQWFKSKCGIAASESDREVSFCAHAVAQDKPLVVEDTLDDDRFCDHPAVLNDPGIRFYAGYPVRAPSGHNVGTFCIADSKPRRLAEREFQSLKDMAHAVEDELQLRDVVHLHKELSNVNNQLAEANREMQRQNEFIRNVFGAHMTEKVAAELLDSPGAVTIGGEEKHVTLLMCDLRGFTELAQELPPRDVIKLLNRYLGAMIECVSEHEGIVDQILGDGILALFGVPQSHHDDAYRASSCAVSMQHSMERVNEENEADGLPQIRIGVGVNTGEVIVGNIGSERRMKYSVIGSAVNLAARIQSLCLGGQVLISEATRHEAGDCLEFQGHMRVKLRGVADGVTVHDLRHVRTGEDCGK